MLTCGTDRQLDRYVYCVEAWGADGRSHTVQYGEEERLDALLTSLLARRWPYVDGFAPATIAMTFVDSGYRPADVYRLCAAERRRGVSCWASKGSSTPS